RTAPVRRWIGDGARGKSPIVDREREFEQRRTWYWLPAGSARIAPCRIRAARRTKSATTQKDFARRHGDRRQDVTHGFLPRRCPRRPGDRTKGSEERRATSLPTRPNAAPLACRRRARRVTLVARSAAVGNRRTWGSAANVLRNPARG